MKKSLHLISTIVIVLIVYSVGLQEGNTKSDGSPLGNTGSPGDGANSTCARFGCHVGTVNAFPGSVSIDASSIPANGYAPGVTYSIKVTVAESGRTTYGFQMTAEDNSQNKMGTYTANSAVRIEFQDWVTHRMNSGSGVFTFDWTAPFSSEDITFYAAGNAANGNGSSTGDHIYTSSTSIVRDPIASSVAERSPNIEQVFFNSFSKTLVVNSKRESIVKLFSVSGQQLSELNIGIGINNILTSSFVPGVYILLEPKTGYSYRFVVS